MTLGQLIGELERVPPSASVSYDEGGNPGAFHSYRGYYDQLALGCSGEPMTVARLLERAKEADGGVFTGWKGGGDNTAYIGEYA